MSSNGLIPLATKILFPDKKKNKEKSTNESQSARSEPIVFAIFLTDNEAFIESAFEKPPTYDSGRRECVLVDSRGYFSGNNDEEEKRQRYELNCVRVLDSGKFRRVQFYTDSPLASYYVDTLQHLLKLCKALDIQADLTTAPCPENVASPRAQLLLQHNQKCNCDHNMLRKLNHILVKMTTVLQGKLLLNNGELPEDADTVFAFHDCWKQLYNLLKHQTEEDIQVQRLYSLQLNNYYHHVPL